MQLPDNALHNACLVVAHPDDEVLWFGSILEQVDRIVLCFSDAERWPDLGEARRNSISDHACADRIHNLEIAQVPSHNLSRWPRPDETSYGLRLDKKPGFDAPYQLQAARLEAALTPLISSYDNVFTHNPWGEYGHEDHVQVHRIVTRIAEAQGAAVWYDNYVSNKSGELMRRYMNGFGHAYYEMPVDTRRVREIADTYFRNGAWTWLDDYEWFDWECFVPGPLIPREAPGEGTLFPLNFIRVLFDPTRAKSRRFGLLKRLRRKVTRLLGKSNGSPDSAATS